MAIAYLMPALDTATTLVQGALHACRGAFRTSPQASARQRHAHAGSIALAAALLLVALLVAFAAPALGHEAGDLEVDPMAGFATQHPPAQP